MNSAFNIGIYAVYELMTEKVKDHKKHIAPSETTNSDGNLL